MKLKKIFILSFSSFIFPLLVPSVQAATVIETTTTTEQGNGIVRQVQYYDHRPDVGNDEDLPPPPPSNIYMAPPSVQMMDREEYMRRQDMNVERDKVQLREDEESLKNAYDHLNYEKTNPAHVGIELYRHNINESTKIVNYYEQVVEQDKHKLESDMRNSP
jgi:hypothetical protein